MHLRIHSYVLSSSQRKHDGRWYWILFSPRTRSCETSESTIRCWSFLCTSVRRAHRWHSSSEQERRLSSTCEDRFLLDQTPAHHTTRTARVLFHLVLRYAPTNVKALRLLDTSFIRNTSEDEFGVYKETHEHDQLFNNVCARINVASIIKKKNCYNYTISIRKTNGDTSYIFRTSEWSMWHVFDIWVYHR